MYIFIYNQLTELHPVEHHVQKKTFSLHDLDHADTKSKLSVSVYIGFHFEFLTVEVFIWKLKADNSLVTDDDDYETWV